MSTAETQNPPPPLAVGSTLDAGFALLRRHARPLLLPQLALNLVAMVIAVIVGVVGWLSLGDVATTLETRRESSFFGDSSLEVYEVPDFTDGQTVVVVIAVTIIAIILAWATIAAYVSVVRGAERALAGEPALPLKAAVRQALRAVPKLFVLGIVFAIGWIIFFFGLVLVVAIVAEASSGLAVIVGIAAFCLLVYVGVRLFLWPVVHLSEGLGMASFGRAWQISRGRFWALFGVLVLVSIVVGVINFVVTMVLQLAVGGLFALDDTAGAVALAPYIVLVVLFSLVFVAAYVAPVVVAHRTLAGTDTASLWRAAEEMQRPAEPDAFGRAPEAGSGPWATAEPGSWAPGGEGGPPPSSGGDPAAPGGEPDAGGTGGGWARPSDPSGE
ncbi:hypothetical protein [Patulibacter defluvii]|uniref:hypothetical protein n=1 Tax=Patulibacter defluvii TaxID=3095358 RepID=UPI002A7520EB|nr:hypothetical protein [Patulibacter sp. DM4]